MNSNEKFTDPIDFHRREKAFQEGYQRGFRRFAMGYSLSALEVDILFAVYADAGCDSVTKLCKDINKTKGVVSKACEHLCQIGYFVGKNDEKDRRVVHFKLAPAARAVILGMARYTEAMKDLRRLEQLPCTDLLFLARVDLKKNLIYPVYSVFPLPDAVKMLPFCDYQNFWQLTLAPKLRESDVPDFTAEMTAAALEKELNEKQTSLQKTALICDHDGERRLVTDITALDHRNENVIITIKEADAK